MRTTPLPRIPKHLKVRYVSARYTDHGDGTFSIEMLYRMHVGATFNTAVHSRQFYDHLSTEDALYVGARLRDGGLKLLGDVPLGMDDEVAS